MDRIIYHLYKISDPEAEKTSSYMSKLYEDIKFNMYKNDEDLDIKKEVKILVEFINVEEKKRSCLV